MLNDRLLDVLTGSRCDEYDNGNPGQIRIVLDCSQNFMAIVFGQFEIKQAKPGQRMLAVAYRYEILHRRAAIGKVDDIDILTTLCDVEHVQLGMFVANFDQQ